MLTAGRPGSLSCYGRLFLGIFVASVALAAAPVAAQEGSWTSTGSLGTGRFDHTVTVLPNGKVLIAGGDSGTGNLSSAELYDPATGMFAPTGSMVTARRLHTATLLRNGKVLIAGGTGAAVLNSAELFDPATGTFAAVAAPMVAARAEHTATLLSNGTVLLVGGSGSGGTTLASAEVFDPVTGLFSAAATMFTSRTFHTATPLPDGSVLIAGGLQNRGAGPALASAVRYSSSGASVVPTGSMAAARYSHTATLLPNGKVLVAGGRGTFTPVAELYDPNAFDPPTESLGTFSMTGSMVTARADHAAALLPNGLVLLTGGATATAGATRASEVFDAATETFTATGNMIDPRAVHNITLLPNGEVLATGGIGSTGLARAELYCPAMPGTPGTWTTTGSLTTPRSGHAAALLPTGKVLIVGGRGSAGHLNSPELYELYGPSAGTFQETANSMTTTRGRIVAVRLSSGKVLIAGGEATPDGGALTTADLFEPFANGGAGRFSATGSMSTGRVGHALTLLPNGQVLVTGGANVGSDASFNSAEIFDGISAFRPLTATMREARRFHSTTLLPNGTILIVGGIAASAGSVSATAEVFDPQLGTFTLLTGPGTALTTARYGHTAMLLPNGKVLIAGGFADTPAGGVETPTAELFDPATGTFTPTGSLTTPRSSHAAVLLPNGQVLIVGDQTGPGTTTELFDPSSGTFTATGAMATSRAFNTATLLPTGQVLAAGTNPAERYSFAICAGNTPPVARDDAFSVFENVALTGNVLSNDFDADEDPLTAILVAGVNSGTLNLNTNGSFTYTPAPNFTGNVTFTYKANDGRADSNIATVSITVNPNATATAVSVATIVAGATGAQSLGDLLLTENVAGALVTGGRIFLRLPSCMSFGSTPVVSLVVANGMIVDTGRLEDVPGTFSFAILTPSSVNPATLRISGISINAAACETTGAVDVSLGGVSVRNGTAVFQSNTPAIADVSPSQVGRGAQALVVDVFGANFAAQPAVAFRNNGAPDGNLQASGVAVDGGGTHLSFLLSVNAAAALGPRDLTITNVGGGPVTATGALTVASAPTVTASSRTATITTQACPLIRGVSGQTLLILGSDFQPATTAPLTVEFVDLTTGNVASGISITVPRDPVTQQPLPGAIAYDTPAQIHSDRIAVDASAPSSVAIRVTNPDGGRGTSAGGIVFIANAPPAPGCPAVASDAGAPSTTPPPPPTPPGITGLNPSTGRLGGMVTISGAGFNTTASLVTFAGPGNTRVPATILTNPVPTPNQLAVTVPAGAITGEVTVSVTGLVSDPACAVPNCNVFTISNPQFGSVIPASAAVGTGATLSLRGANFGPQVSVQFGPAGSPFTATPTVNLVSSTEITVSGILVGTPGDFDVTVKNLASNGTDLGSDTRPKGFSVRPAETLVLTLVSGNVDVTETYLPTVERVSATRNSNGTCTSIVTPTPVTLRATSTSTTPPTQVTFNITSVSALRGTAINDDCDAAIPIDDFSFIDGVGNKVKTITVNVAGQMAETTLYSYDFGGTVTIQATGSNGGTATKVFPLDTDGDGLYDAYETMGCATPAGCLNANGIGQNVLDRMNGVPGGNDKTAADGLINSAKQRGFYRQATVNANTFVMMKADHERLGAGVRQMFLRGRGFANDSLIQTTPGTCGINLPTTSAAVSPGFTTIFVGSTLGFAPAGSAFLGGTNAFAYTGTTETSFTGVSGINATWPAGTEVTPTASNPLAMPDPNLATIPCPQFRVGDAFRNIALLGPSFRNAAIKVHDMTPSFTGTTVFPTQSFTNPATSTLDLGTIIYDAGTCSGACARTSKTGARQWTWPSPGSSGIGTGSVYGAGRVIKPIVDAILLDRPYQHRENANGAFVRAPEDGRAMLAPLAIVGDNSSRGADNGAADSKEVLGTAVGAPGTPGASGNDNKLAGDTYIPGNFNVSPGGLSAIDATNDGCPELPFITDPTALDRPDASIAQPLSRPCIPTAASARYPQATRQQIVEWLITHEAGHLAGVSGAHTTEPSDIMYQYLINWERLDSFSSAAATQIQIHAGGQQ